MILDYRLITRFLSCMNLNRLSRRGLHFRDLHGRFGLRLKGFMHDRVIVYLTDMLLHILLALREGNWRGGRRLFRDDGPLQQSRRRARGSAPDSRRYRLSGGNNRRRDDGSLPQLRNGCGRHGDGCLQIGRASCRERV